MLHTLNVASRTKTTANGILIPARTKIFSSSHHGGCGEGTACHPIRMSVCCSHFFRIHRLSAPVGAHVLCGFCRALYARLSSKACDIIATGSRASVEHDLIAGESIQNLVNDLSIVQCSLQSGNMFSTTWMRSSSVIRSPRSLSRNRVRCSNKCHSGITSALKDLFRVRNRRSAASLDTRRLCSPTHTVGLPRTSFDDALRG